MQLALVKFARRLAMESGYQVEERKVGGQRVFEVGGHGEVLVVLGVEAVRRQGRRGRGLPAVPEDVVSFYGKRYPSQLAEGALDVDVDEEAAKEAEKGGEGAKPTKPSKARRHGERAGGCPAEHEADAADEPAAESTRRGACRRRAKKSKSKSKSKKSRKKSRR